MHFIFFSNAFETNRLLFEKSLDPMLGTMKGIYWKYRIYRVSQKV